MERIIHSLSTSGIYQIRSIINGKLYVGSANHFKDRKWDHLKRLKNKNHGSYLLQRHYDVHGENNLIFEIIEIVSRKINEDILSFKKRLLEREQYYIDTLKPEFNIAKIAGSPLGIKRSEDFKQKHRGENSVSKRFDVKRKQSEARKKYWESHEHPFGERNSFYKRKHTKKTRNMIGNKNRGNLKGNQYAKGNRFSHTPEEIEKMRNSWTPEMRLQASIRAKQQYKEGKGLAKINSKFKQERNPKV